MSEEISWDTLGQAIEGAQDAEEDAPPFSLLSGTGLGGLLDADEKVPLERAAHLLLMREAAEQIRRDQIGPEEFLEKVLQVASVADNGIKLFSSEVMQKETSKLPEDQAELVMRFEEQLHKLKKGTDLMAAYVESNNIDDLDQGLALVEESMQNVDQIQDSAIEHAKVFRAAEAEAKAAAAQESES